MGAVDEDARGEAAFCEEELCEGKRCVVGAGRAAAQDDVGMGVALGGSEVEAA